MSQSEAAKKAWITRRANAGVSKGPAKIASAKAGAARATSSSKPTIVNMVGAMAWPGSKSGGAFRSRFAAKSAKAIPAMLAELKKRGFGEHVVANHGTHFAVYFNPEGKKK